MKVEGTRHKGQGTRFKVQGSRFNAQDRRHKTQDLKQKRQEPKIKSMSKELEDRFHAFAKSVRDFCLKLKWDIINKEYIKQLIRSSASISANYIEASDDLGKADEKMKLKISRREAKESLKWLDLILTYDNTTLEREKLRLIDEAEQIKKILSAIIKKLGG